MQLQDPAKAIYPTGLGSGKRKIHILRVLHTYLHVDESIPHAQWQ